MSDYQIYKINRNQKCPDEREHLQQKHYITPLLNRYNSFNYFWYEFETIKKLNI